MIIRWGILGLNMPGFRGTHLESSPGSLMDPLGIMNWPEMASRGDTCLSRVLLYHFLGFLHMTGVKDVLPSNKAFYN